MEILNTSFLVVSKLCHKKIVARPPARAWCRVRPAHQWLQA